MESVTTSLPDPASADTGGRREANRLRTRAALIDAVRSFAREQGLATVTIEDLAERAEISRRTFHNYFPNVPAAIAAAMIELLEPIGERFLARPSDEHPLESARIALAYPHDLLSMLCGIPDDDDQVTLRIQMESDHQLEAWLRSLMERRLDGTAGQALDDVYVRVLTSTLHGAFAAAEDAWAEQTGRDPSDAGRVVFDRTLTRALGYAMHGFADPRAERPRPASAPTPDSHRPTTSGHLLVPDTDPQREHGSSTKG